jgi:hypothetical protein
MPYTQTRNKEGTREEAEFFSVHLSFHLSVKYPATSRPFGPPKGLLVAGYLTLKFRGCTCSAFLDLLFTHWSPRWEKL